MRFLQVDKNEINFSMRFYLAKNLDMVSLKRENKMLDLFLFDLMFDNFIIKKNSLCKPCYY